MGVRRSSDHAEDLTMSAFVLLALVTYLIGSDLGDERRRRRW
jgi:hypothetical protein